LIVNRFFENILNATPEYPQKFTKEKDNAKQSHGVNI